MTSNLQDRIHQCNQQLNSKEYREFYSSRWDGIEVHLTTAIEVSQAEASPFLSGTPRALRIIWESESIFDNTCSAYTLHVYNLENSEEHHLDSINLFHALLDPTHYQPSTRYEGRVTLQEVPGVLKLPRESYYLSQEIYVLIQGYLFFKGKNVPFSYLLTQKDAGLFIETILENPKCQRNQEYLYRTCVVEGMYQGPPYLPQRLELGETGPISDISKLNRVTSLFLTGSHSVKTLSISEINSLKVYGTLEEIENCPLKALGRARLTNVPLHRFPSRIEELLRKTNRRDLTSALEELGIHYPMTGTLLELDRIRKLPLHECLNEIHNEDTNARALVLARLGGTLSLELGPVKPQTELCCKKSTGSFL